MNLKEKLKEYLFPMFPKEEVNDTCIEDYCVATFQIEENKIHWLFNSIYVNKDSFRKKDLAKKKYRDVLIILESPGTSEIENPNNGPAVGKSGRIINNYFFYHLSSFLNFDFVKGEDTNLRSLVDKYVGKYNLWFINTIQYNTKYNNKSYFDDLIKIPEFQTDFEERLKRHKPFIVINACTANSKSLINDLILKAYQHHDFLLLNTYHPSSGDTWCPFFDYRLFEEEE